MTKSFIGFIPDFEESKQIVIAKWKTMEEAIEFAKEKFWFTGDKMGKVEWKDDTWIGIMKRTEYTININEKIKK